MKRIGCPVVLAVGILSLAGCTSSAPPVSKPDAARDFTAAYSSFLAGGRAIQKQDPLPTATHPESQRPTSAEDSQLANLIDRYRKSLTSISWPQPAAGEVGAVESALSKEATEVRSIEGVSGTSPVLGTDYRTLASTEKIELTAENRLRRGLGLPRR
jgi:hypothetical protein